MWSLFVMFTAALGFYFLLKQSAGLSSNTRSRHMGRLANKFQDHQTSRTGQVEHGCQTNNTPHRKTAFSWRFFCSCFLCLGNSHNAYGYPRWQSCHLYGCVSAYMLFFLLLALFFFFFCTYSLKKLSPTEFSNSAIVFGAHELYKSGC